MGIKGMYLKPSDCSVLISKGLLPLLKSVHKHCNLKKFSGQTIGVDAYGWLHRGVVGCAFALALDKPTTIHIDFVLSRVRMLLDFGVTPYLVLDGDNLPSKAGTNAARRKKREESRALGLELHRAGKTAQAQQELQKAIDVTPLMARQLIEELKKLNVQYIVAPYEADAQLVYLEQKGIIDGILAEDSDMLVFGAKRLLTKLNQYGELVEIERADFILCKEISFAGWTDTMFRRMAILSGCDYLPNIGKLGLKTAHSLVRKYNDIEKILRIIQLEGKLIVPSAYLEQFRDAELTFLHHRVFCPVAQKMVHLNDLAPGISGSDMPFLGPYVDPETALGVACGDLDPFSKRPIRITQKPLVRPALGNQRSQSYASAPDLKPKKSIETFFKPHRQPLAELNPNSLTPSPSQQRLLERNRDASWEPRLISSAPALRGSTTVSAASTSSADRTVFLARASTKSMYQPPKRQRLCSDAMDPSPTKEVKQSPFFSSKIEEASPLAPKPRKNKRAQKSRFEIFSDEGEMLLKTQVQQAASPDKGVPTMEAEQADARQVFEGLDTQGSIPRSSPPVVEWRSPTGSIDITPPPNATITNEVKHDDDSDAFEDLLEYHVRKQNEALLKVKQKGSLMQTFAFQTAQGRDRALRSVSPADPRKQIHSAASEEVRMGAFRCLPKASNIETFCEEVKLPRTWDRSSPAVQLSALESLSRAGAPSKVGNQTLAKPARSVNSKERRPTTDSAGPRSSLTKRTEVRGSEDAIVPNSEDDTSEVGSPAMKPKFNASAFEFVSA